MELLSRAGSPAADLRSLMRDRDQARHPQPYLPVGNPRGAEDILQLETDPKCRVRDHFAQVDAAPQDQGLTCTPAPGRRSGCGQCPRQEESGTGGAQGSPPLPGCRARPPRAAALHRLCLRHQHSHLRRLDEAQAVVDADVQPPLPNRHPNAIRCSVSLQWASFPAQHPSPCHPWPGKFRQTQKTRTHTPAADGY